MYVHRGCGWEWDVATGDDGRCEEVPSEATVHAWARLVRVGQSVLADVEADLKRAGLPPLAHYDALLELQRAGRDGLRPFELQREMLLAQYNVSRLVERLARAGHVERDAAEGDGRGQVLRITPAGSKLLARMWPTYAGAIERRFGQRLTEGEARALADTLGKLRAPDG